jgi:serine/threonine protein phosphatase PrpC
MDRCPGARADIGFASETGPRRQNEDFAGAILGWKLPKPRHDTVAALADGIGGAKGGRVAAETAVRGFLDGFCDMPEGMEVRPTAVRVLGALNRWIFSIGQRDAALTGMGCTFTALVLRGDVTHVLHVGDSRAYRMRDDRLTLLTTDHVQEADGHRTGVLTRALGTEAQVRFEYASVPLAPHDRYLLCSDGVHSVLSASMIAAILRERMTAGDSARALVATALRWGSLDNATALVVDIVDLAPADAAGPLNVEMQKTL